jgi:hypothetical protein
MPPVDSSCSEICENGRRIRHRIPCRGVIQVADCPTGTICRTRRWNASSVVHSCRPSVNGGRATGRCDLRERNAVRCDPKGHPRPAHQAPTRRRNGQERAAAPTTAHRVDGRPDPRQITENPLSAPSEDSPRTAGCGGQEPPRSWPVDDVGNALATLELAEAGRASALVGARQRPGCPPPPFDMRHESVSRRLGWISGG